MTMKTSIRISLLCALSALLVSCGGSMQGTQAPRMLASSTHTSAAQHTTADYYDVLQHIYLAYFGRPGDPAGLDFYAGNFLAHGAPTNIVDLATAYRNHTLDPVVVSIVDSFGTSAESQALYPGDNNSFVTAVYHNLFSREPDAGKDFWVGAIDRGAITRADAAIEIMAGSQASDLAIIENKAKVAASFTSSLNTDAARAAYSGLDANVVVRNLLLSVVATTDPSAFQGAIDAAIATLINTLGTNIYAKVASIVQLRCVGCHSAHPTIPGFSPAPLGIMFDTSDQIHSRAADIYQNVVVLQFMPFANTTHMTDDERATIATWHDLGSP
jgi:hypothetical protein